MAVKPLLNVQWPPMSLEKVWQAILRQFWRYVRPGVNPKDGIDFNEIVWSFLDQSRRWGQLLQTWSPLPLPSLSCSERVTEQHISSYWYVYIYVPDVLVVGAARCYVMSEKLSVKPYLKCSNHWKPPKEIFLKGTVCFDYCLLLTSALLLLRK